MIEKTCVKCGGAKATQYYNKYQDCLELKCSECGYQSTETPLDKRTTDKKESVGDKVKRLLKG